MGGVQGGHERPTVCPPIRGVHSVAHFPPHTHTTHTHTLDPFGGHSEAQRQIARAKRKRRTQLIGIGKCGCAKTFATSGQPGLLLRRDSVRSVCHQGDTQMVVIIDYVFDVLVAGQPVGHCDVENMLL